MVREVELAALDGRYESYRLRQPAVEAQLLTSIAERGIAEPLEGVEQGGRSVVLNGFKRWRCARKLGLTSAPYVSLGEDAALGIVALLRASNDRALSLLEQAGFVDELRRLHQMSVAEIAAALSRSVGWVSMRLGLLAEMPPLVRQKLFAGLFPVYAYMYSIRPFMRMNSVARGDVEQFVAALSAKHLSVREIEQLAHGYFRGPETLRDQIRAGNVALPLEALKRVGQTGNGCTLFEQAMLNDLAIAQKYVQRVSAKSHDPRLASAAFRVQAQLLLAGLLSRAPSFFESVKDLHDRCGQA
jgi:hypothetical protein